MASGKEAPAKGRELVAVLYCTLYTGFLSQLENVRYWKSIILPYVMCIHRVCKNVKIDSKVNSSEATKIFNFRSRCEHKQLLLYCMCVNIIVGCKDSIKPTAISAWIEAYQP